MPVDASIPLQTNPVPQSNILQNVGQAIQVGQQMQDFQGQRALKEAFQNADMSTPQGQQALISKVGATSPKEAMALQSTFQKQRETQSTIDKNKAQTKKVQLENLHSTLSAVDDAGSVLMYKYTDLVNNKKMAPQDAARIVSADIPVVKAHLAAQRLPDGTPMLSDEQLARMPDQFDPQKFGASTMDAKNAKEHVEMQLKMRQQDSIERHQGVEENQGQQRIGIEGANAATNRGRLGLESQRLGFEENQPKSEVGKITADFKSGRISESDYKSSISKATGGADPASIEPVAKGIADGSLPPLTGNALRTPGGLRTMARVMELNPDFDAKDYGTHAKSEKDFATGKQGNTVRSLNVAMSHLDVLSEAGRALKNGDLTDLNRIANDIASRTGGAAPTNFNEAKKIVSDEVVKAVVGAGGGVSDREEAAKAFNDANSPAQLEGAIAIAKKLLAGQQQGLRRQYKAATGKDDFDKRFLSPEAERLENTPLPGQGASGPTGNPPLPPSGTISWDQLK